MTINTRATEAISKVQPLDVLALYRTMVMARVTNDLLKTRKTQGKFPFYIGCAGHEGMAAVAAALDEKDWLSLYYRDLAAWLQRTGDVYGPLREAYSRTTGPMCAGRNMPSHYSSKKHRILPTFSEVGALAPFAGGVGFSLKRHESKLIFGSDCACSDGKGGGVSQANNPAAARLGGKCVARETLTLLRNTLTAARMQRAASMPCDATPIEGHTAIQRSSASRRTNARSSTSSLMVSFTVRG